MHIWQVPSFEQQQDEITGDIRPSTEQDFVAGALNPLHYGDAASPGHQLGIENLRDQSPGFRAVQGLENMAQVFNDDAAPEVCVNKFH